MYKYPVLEQDGICFSVSTQKQATRRWRASVQLERDSDHARLHLPGGKPVPVPNDYPSEEQAVQAAYAHARQLIARATAEVHARQG